MFQDLSKYLVEFLGTMIFLHTVLATGNPLAIAATLALVKILGDNISGGNFNPAITIMLAAANKLHIKDVAPYIIAQVAGAFAAIQLHKLHLSLIN